MKRIVNFGFGLYIAFVFAIAGNAIADDCPLCTAVFEGDVLAVNRLIANSPNLNVLHDLNAPHDKNGETVLMKAARGERVEIVKVLLSAGANLKATDKNGINSLMLVSGKSIVNLQPLISISPTDDLLGEGLLKIWAEGKIKRLWAKQVSTMKVLLEAASPKDINALDNSGWTALMYAAKIGSANATRLLINHGADVNLANADGWTALDIAEEVGDRGVARILRKAGAE